MQPHKQIPLRNAKREIVAYALVSDEDYERVSAVPWCLGGNKKGGSGRYARRNESGKTIYMHRWILGLTHADSEVEVDHINGGKLDNRRENMRPIPAGAQNQNQAKARGKAGRRGVIWDARRGKWQARATVNGKVSNLGRFDSLDDAARVAAEFRAKHLPYSIEALKVPAQFMEEVAA